MEYWNVGIMCSRSGWSPNFFSVSLAKNRSHSARPNIPVFHHSIIPGQATGYLCPLHWVNHQTG